MLSFAEFTNYIKENIKSELPPEYQQHKIIFHQVNKTNLKLTGIALIDESKNEGMSPLIYLEDLYSLLKEGLSPEQIVKEIAEIYVQCEQKRELIQDDFLNMMDFDRAKEHFGYRLINREKNKGLLEDAVWEPIEDLAKVCYIIVKNKEIGWGSAKISESMLKAWNKSKDEVLALAKENMPKLFPAKLISVSAVPNLNKNELEKKQYHTKVMMSITNKECDYGATAFFYPGIAERIGEIYGEDFYVMPSSVHEFMVLPKSAKTTERDLGELVREANESLIKGTDILSDRVYEYSRLEKKLKTLKGSLPPQMTKVSERRNEYRR